MSCNNSQRRRARVEKKKNKKAQVKQRRVAREHNKELRKIREYGDLSREEKMCTTKQRYSSETAAIHKIIFQTRVSGKPLRAYKCPYCNGWHITSSVRIKGTPLN